MTKICKNCGHEKKYHLEDGYCIFPIYPGKCECKKFSEETKFHIKGRAMGKTCLPKNHIPQKSVNRLNESSGKYEDTPSASVGSRKPSEGTFNHSSSSPTFAEKNNDSDTPSASVGSRKPSEGTFNNLSEKRQDRKYAKPIHNTRYTYSEENIKTFIKKLKEVRRVWSGKMVRYNDLINEIDKLAGEDLI